MHFETITYALLLQLLMFVGWSALLLALALLINKIRPALGQWSRLWQAIFVLAIAPFIVQPSSEVNAFIPDVLKSPWQVDNLQPLLEHKLSHDIIEYEFTTFILFAVMGLLLFGTVIHICRFFRALNQLRKLVNQCTTIDELSRATAAQHATILRHSIKVVKSEQSMSPFVCGLLSNTLVLPHYVFEMESGAQRLLIEHELNHCKRWDPKSVIVMRFISALCWFNPFIALLEQRFLLQMEINCDADVLRQDPKKNLQYAQALMVSLKQCSLKESSRQSEQLVSSNFADPHTNKQQFETRLRLTMADTPSKPFNKWHLLLLSLTVFMVLVSSVGAKPFVIVSDLLSDKQGVMPIVNARVSSGFGHVSSFRGNKAHKAIDFAAPLGTNVTASLAGVVVSANATSLNKNYGKVVLIKHHSDQHTLYAHLDSFNVSVGEYIIAGQKIGTVGVTGRSTGPHLHFELIEGGQRINPSEMLALTSNQ